MDLIEINIIEQISSVEIDVTEILQPIEIEINEIGQKGKDGLDGLGVTIFNEIPSGLLNGVNAVFTTQLLFSKVIVKLNGITQSILDDYQVSNNNTITFLISPGTTDKILVDYTKL